MKIIRFSIALAMAFALTFSAEHRAHAASKRIYIAPDIRTGYMWRNDEAGYRAAFIDMLDYYLNLADTTQSLPAEYQSRWNCDGSLWLWEYEKNKTEVEFNRLLDRIRDGHINVPLNALNSCYGAPPAEAILRGMYYPGRIERKYGIEFPMAVSSENQTLPYGLGSLWAGAGAKYTWKGITSARSNISGAGDRAADIYWWTGPDGSRLLTKWNTRWGSDTGMGGYAEARTPHDVVEFIDTDPDFIARYPYSVAGAFGYGYLSPVEKTHLFVTTAQSETTPDRQIVVSNQVDFFEDFEQTHGGEIPTQSLSFGNQWDLLCATLAEVSGRVKRSVEKLRAAEALATLVAAYDPSFTRGREEARDLAFMNLGMYWEANWTADGPYITREARAAWQRRVADNIETYVDELYSDGLDELSRMIRHSSYNPLCFVFNPLGWTRTDVAELPYDGPADIHVVDVTLNQEVPSQIVSIDGERRLRILASDVPPIGYKTFMALPGPGAEFENAADVAGDEIENDFYRVTLAERGAIVSFIDKRRGNREMAKRVLGRSLNDLGPGSGLLEVENVGPVSVTLKAVSSDPVEHTTRITLLRDVDRVEIRNEITENFSGVQAWAFGFNLDSPDVWHEETGAVIRAKRSDAGGHYSTRNARVDWLTFNHFADISGSDGAGATLSNADCHFMKLGASRNTFLDTETPLISALAGGQIDSVDLGIRGQGGDEYFLQRFALQTRDSFDAASAMRFALEHQNPLASNWISGGMKLPRSSYSLVAIDESDALLWALKPAERGIFDGVIARFWNLGDTPEQVQLRWERGPFTSAELATHIETPIGEGVLDNGALSESLAARRMQTYRLWKPDLTDTSVWEQYK